MRTSAKGRVGQMRTPADRGSIKRGHFLRTSFMDDPLSKTDMEYSTVQSTAIITVFTVFITLFNFFTFLIVLILYCVFRCTLRLFCFDYSLILFQASDRAANASDFI